MTVTRILMAACLAFSLLGCQAPLTSRLAPAPQAPQAEGHLQLTINWPTRLQSGYEVAAIPNRTQAFRLAVLRDGIPVGAPRTFVRPDSSSATTSLQIELPAGDGYVLEAKAYDSETAFDEAHLVAQGTSAPFAIQSGRRTPVSLSLTVTNAPTLDDAQIPDGAARLAELILVGEHFGTDLAMIQATLKQGTQDPQPVQVLELVSPTRLRVKLPDTATTGSAMLKVFVDGIASNEVPVKILSSLEVLSTFAKRDASDFRTYYVPASVPLPKAVRGSYYDDGWKTLSDLAMTCKVTTGGQDVTATVLDAEGRLTLPAGTYSIEYASGAENVTITAIAAPLRWSSSTLGPLRVAPYYITGIASPGNKNEALGVDMSGFYYDTGLGVFLEPGDFTWDTDPPGFLSFEFPYYFNRRVIFDGTSQAGTGTVTGTLKYDSTRTLSFQAANVRIQDFTFQRATDPADWNSAWSDTVPAPLTLKVGEKARPRVRSLSLTDGTSVTVSEDYNFSNWLGWESRLVGGGAGSGVATANEEFGEGVITAVAPGEVEIRVWHEQDPLRTGTVLVTVTN
jgi:hypothetical protein